MATEEQLVDLNNKVYKVDPDYKKDGKETQDIINGQIITVAGEKFQVISTSNTTERTHGFSGMAVAPINKGVVDYGNVTIIAAGTNPKSPNDLGGAVDGVFDISSQYEAAERYVAKLMADNPDWNVNQLSGYSQSAYMLKLGAKYHIPTTVFHGWFNYNSLTKEERAYMDAHKAQYINYRSHEEEVGGKFVISHDAKNTAGSVYYIGGVTSHLLASFKFDKNGNIKFNIEDSQGEEKISNLQASIAKSSGATKISLRENLIKTVSEHAKDLAEGYELLIKSELDKAILDIETVVQEINQGAYEIKNYLEYWEVDNLIQNYQKDDFWDNNLESSVKEKAKNYKDKVIDFSTTLQGVSRAIQAYDKEAGGQLFKDGLNFQGRIK